MKNGKNKVLTEKDFINNRNEYFVFWYDARMKNYLNILEYVMNRTFLTSKITIVLVVDKFEFIKNIEKIKNESKNEKLKGEVIALVKQPILDTDKL